MFVSCGFKMILQYVTESFRFFCQLLSTHHEVFLEDWSEFYNSIVDICPSMCHNDCPNEGHNDCKQDRKYKFKYNLKICSINDLFDKDLKS
jgi:hypothetical protein